MVHMSLTEVYVENKLFGVHEDAWSLDAWPAQHRNNRYAPCTVRYKIVGGVHGPGLPTEEDYLWSFKHSPPSHPQTKTGIRKYRNAYSQSMLNKHGFPTSRIPIGRPEPPAARQQRFRRFGRRAERDATALGASWIPKRIDLPCSRASMEQHEQQMQKSLRMMWWIFTNWDFSCLEHVVAVNSKKWPCVVT